MFKITGSSVRKNAKNQVYIEKQDTEIRNVKYERKSVAEFHDIKIIIMHIFEVFSRTAVYDTYLINVHSLVISTVEQY